MKSLVCLLILTVLSATVFAQNNKADKLRQTAEIFAAAYNARDYAPIEKEFNARMRDEISSERFAAFLADVRKNYGNIVRLGTPGMPTAETAVFPAEFERAEFNLIVTLDAENKIAGLHLSLAPEPPAPLPPKSAKRSQTKFGLPFKGEWLVFWGGDTTEQNYHQDVPNQRFAFDIIKVDAAGKSHKGDGKRNEDYYAFGQELVAPADGIVTDVINGIRDNAPGEMNRMYAPGNTVVIKHGEDEYSFFAHLKLDSARVKVGDKVTKNQVIGLCGNSGNSSEAHLHYQLQQTPFFSDENSVKVFFEKLTMRREAKAEAKIDYSPVKGDFVSAN